MIDVMGELKEYLDETAPFGYGYSEQEEEFDMWLTIMADAERREDADSN